MFVVEITAALVTLIWLANITGIQAAASTSSLRLPAPDRDLAVVHRAVRDLRGGGRRGARPCPGRDAAQDAHGDEGHRRAADGTLEAVGSSELRKGDIIVVEEGQTIPGDGDVIEGVGFVNEAAITGESAPVLKEPGTDIRIVRHRRHDARQRPARRSASPPTRARRSSTA